jgi:Mg2+ and Co2+ transporter CorA
VKNYRIINAVVTPDTHRKIREIAKADKRTMKAYVALLIERDVEKQMAKAKQAEVVG